MRQDQKLKHTAFNKKGIAFSVATPDMWIFDEQSQRSKYLKVH